jgi:ribokinase
LDGCRIDANMILVAGSANLDFVVRAPHIPLPGETVLGRELSFFPGGKGANQAIACARAGDTVTEMLLAVGDDWFAEPIEASLSAAGVGMHKIQVPDQRTGAAFICVSDDAENAITVASGANSALCADDLPPLSDYSHLLLQLETPIPTVTAYACAAKEQGVAVVLNAAPAQDLPQDLLASVDILIVNEGELAAIANHHGSIVDCLGRVAVPCVVVTLGSRGCCAKLDGNFITQPGFEITALDTTAAGDTFCGVLVAALSRQRNLAQSLREASAAGAITCTGLGAQTSIPTFGQVEKFLKDNPLHTEAEKDDLRRYCEFGYEE